jgi:hypothetical protein
VLAGDAPAAAVPDELHDVRRGAAGPGGLQVPGPDPVPAGTGEFRVVYLDRKVEVLLIPDDPGFRAHLTRCRELPCPPVVESFRLGGRRPVLTELLQRQVIPGHRCLRVNAQDPHAERLDSDRIPSLVPVGSGECVESVPYEGSVRVDTPASRYTG